MKVIPALLAMAVSAWAASSDPGESAMMFLEKVRSGNLNLEPGGDTALTRQTSAKKRAEIARRLERMASDLGRDPLELGPVKQDGEVAAVLVRKIGGFDPGRQQVIPVALVKRGAEWFAAPVPASFENSGVRYATRLRERLEVLEEWMLRQQRLDLEALRERSTRRMRAHIEARLPADTLRALDSRQTAMGFIAACEKRDLPEILGFLGGLSSALPADWPLRLKAVEGAMATSSLTRPWRLLASPEVLRADVHHEEFQGSALVSFACLDPASKTDLKTVPLIELIHLQLSQSRDGFWRVDLPPEFLQDDEQPEHEDDESLDSDLRDAFPAKLAGLHPPSLPPSAEACSDALVSALHDQSPAAMIPLIRLQGDPKLARQSCTRAVSIWWDLHQPSAIRRAVPLAMELRDDTAAGAFQFFSASLPDRLNLRILYFAKSGDAWHWTPAPAEKTRKDFRQWSEGQTRSWHLDWIDSLLAACPLVDLQQITEAPGEEAAREVVDSWLRAIHSGDVMAAIALTARLDSPDSPRSVLRNLGYEINGERRAGQVATITRISRGTVFTVATARTGTRDKPTQPVYPVVSTAEGPRILIEVDLFITSERTRKFINSEALRHLRKSSPPAADELTKLFRALPTDTPAAENP